MTIGVNEVLWDPDFTTPAGSVLVVRQMIMVDEHGRTITTPQTIDITALPYTAVVQAAAGDSLERLDPLSRVGGAIDVYTNMRLTAGTDTATADLVLWSGDTYTVSAVADYSNWGDGFVVATCTRRDMNSSEGS